MCAKDFLPFSYAFPLILLVRLVGRPEPHSHPMEWVWGMVRRRGGGLGCPNFTLLYIYCSSTKAHAHEQWIKCLICILVLLLQRLVFEINRIVCARMAYADCTHQSRLTTKSMRYAFNTCTLCLFGTILTLNLSFGCVRLRVPMVGMWKCEVLRKFHVVRRLQTTVTIEFSGSGW